MSACANAWLSGRDLGNHAGMKAVGVAFFKARARVLLKRHRRGVRRGGGRNNNNFKAFPQDKFSSAFAGS